MKVFNCRQVLEELGNYLDDTAAADVRRHLEEHMRQCRVCRVLVDTAHKTVRLVTDSGSFELPLDLSSRIMARIREEGQGQVPNFYRAQALSPELVEKQMALFGAVLDDGALCRRLKEHIAVVVSGYNMSTYCVTAHCADLRNMGVTDPELDQLGVDHRSAKLPPAEMALLDFALKLTKSPERMCSQDTEALKQAGYNDAQILEAVLVTAAMNFSNRVSAALEIEPDSPPRNKMRSSS